MDKTNSGPPGESGHGRAARTVAAIALGLIGSCSAPAWVDDPDTPEADREARTPEWIWGSANAADGQTCQFRYAFEVPEPTSSGHLLISCDNHFVAWLNGEEVARGDDWTAPVSVNLDGLARGRHVIAIEGRNDGGPAALGLRVDLEMASGGPAHLVSDRRWRVTSTPREGFEAVGYDDSGWSAAHSFGPTTTTAPWRDVFAPRVATPAASTTVLPGFAVELLRSAQPGEGSWVSMTFDDRGRVILSPQHGGLLRLTLEGDVPAERLDLPVHAAQGLEFAHGSLYANVNAKVENGGGLYRLTDANGDDSFDVVRQLRQHGPGGEHGPHAVVEGPRGDLWVMHGNMTHLADDVALDSPHRHYAEDLLLEREWDPWGHASGLEAPGAQVFRTDPDGRRWELFASGMRNPYDLAFNPDGELFTFDADMEWDIGLPWYRPTRILHVVSGGEYGWRSGSAKWPEHYPDSLPAVVDLGVGSPTGLTFGTDTRFPRRYREALYACDWAYGRIFAVHLEPEGASYVGTAEEFVRGTPLNVTDIAVGPDGALYFTTGGRGTQSGLYRISHRGEPHIIEPHIIEPHIIERSSPRTDDVARSARRELETWHGRRDPRAIDAAWPRLGAEDRFLRYAARIALEGQEPAQWMERAFAEEHVETALTALLALARVGEPTSQGPLLARLASLQPSITARQRLAWLRVFDVNFARMGRPEGSALDAALASLDPLYPAGRYELDRELSRLLVFLDAPGVIERTMQLLQNADDPAEQFHFAFVLRNVADGWTPDWREAYVEWVRTARDREAGHSYSGYLDAIEEDAFGAPLADSLAAGVEPQPAFALQNWQVSELEPVLGEVGMGRSFDAGKAAFTRSLCSACHRIAGAGGSIGPDLTGAVGRFSRRDLLVAIVEPSRDISDQYVNTVVRMRNGDVVSGRVVEDGKRVVLRVGPQGEQRVEVAAADIVERQVSTVSGMPQGLINGLTREEVLDLLVYVEAGGDPEHTSFGR